MVPHCERLNTRLMSISAYLLCGFTRQAIVLNIALVEKLFCSFFNPVISLYIYYDQYEKIWREKILRLVSMEMAAIFDFRALTKVHKKYNFKAASTNAVKSCTHIEDI